MVLIGVRADDVTKEPQTPEHDCLGDRRLSRVGVIPNSELRMGAIPGTLTQKNINDNC